VYVFVSIFVIVQFSKQRNEVVCSIRVFYSYKIHIEKRERKQDIIGEKDSMNGKININQRRRENIPYFSTDNMHVVYNAHPKLIRHSFRCIDKSHDAN
jgi:hypothetical protein